MDMICSDSCDSTSSHKMSCESNKNRTVPAHSIDAILGLKYQPDSERLDSGLLGQGKRRSDDNFEDDLLENDDKARSRQEFYEAEDGSMQKGDAKGQLFYYK